MAKGYPGRLRTVKGRELVAGKKLYVRFPYSEQVIKAIKEVPGCRWNQMGRVWTWPLSAVTAQRLINLLRPLGFTIHPTVHELIKENRQRFLMSSAMRGPVISGLRDFQSAAVAFADIVAGRLLIGDEMGTGKTVEGIAVVKRFKASPCVVVCPASVKLHWKRHIIEWARPPRMDVKVLEGKGSTVPQEALWYVVNYDILQYKVPALTDEGVRGVIVDEAHYIKNHKAKRTKAVLDLCAGVPVVVALDGTPFLNRPSELFTLLNLLKPDKFPSFFDFGRQYCNGHRTQYGWDFNGASNLEELNYELRSSVMIRRTKEDVLAELPPKQRTFLPVKISAKKYRSQDEALTAWIREKREEFGSRHVRAEALVKVTRLRKAVMNAKMPLLREWISDFMENGKPLVVFTHHRLLARELSRRYDALLYSGEVSRKERDRSVDLFQDGKNDLIFLTIDAGGEGITLNRAQDVLFCEFAWSPSRMDQAEDRLHRIGQVGSVTCWYLYAEGTIDEDMLRLLRWKRKTVRSGLGDRADDTFADFLEERASGRRKDG